MPSLIQVLDNDLKLCPCLLVSPPRLHTVVWASPQLAQKHEKSQIGVVLFNLITFLHIINLAFFRSELGRMSSQSMSDQRSTFVRLWIYMHGSPKLLQADIKYNNAVFQNFCHEWNTHLYLLAAIHHEANRIIKCTRRTLRMTSN